MIGLSKKKKNEGFGGAETTKPQQSWGLVEVGKRFDEANH